MFITPEIIALLSLDFIFIVFAFFAFLLSLKIIKYWDINSTNPIQYSLEKKAILVATIVKYIFILKLPLFLFFIFTADKISGVITGAMCGAGVVNSVSFGMWLFVFKILNLFVFGTWIALHVMDLKDEKLLFTKTKFLFFIVAFFLLVIEIFYEISFFSALEIDKIVSCCGTLFSVASSSSFGILFELPNSVTITMFYISFLSLIIAYIIKNSTLFLTTNIIFFIVSITSLILFFSTYIYELPTHHCPFCILQGDYYYVGYLIYITLFTGTFFGISGGVLNLLKKDYNKDYFKTSMIFNSLYMTIVSAYPIVFYIRNGVWL